MLLRDLDYFVWTAEYGSLRRAAVRADVTQPAITKGLRRLETELGLRLLERTTRGTELTEGGLAFLDRARQLRHTLDVALREAQDLSAGTLGLIRAGVAPTLVEPFFNAACEKLIRQRPAVRFRVVNDLSDSLYAGLRRAELDLVLATVPDVLPDELQVEKIGQSALCALARSDHPVFRKRQIGLKELTPYQWVLPRRGVLARDWLDRQFNQAGLAAPKVVIELNTSANSMMSIVAQSDLLSMDVEYPASRLKAGGLRRLLVNETRWLRPVGLFTRRGAYRSPVVSRFLEVLREVQVAGPSDPRFPS